METDRDLKTLGSDGLKQDCSVTYRSMWADSLSPATLPFGALLIEFCIAHAKTELKQIRLGTLSPFGFRSADG